MAQRGDIYPGTYEGLYCVGCEEYYTDTQLAAEETCPVHGTRVEHRKQPSYFFRMSKYQDALLQHFERHPHFVEPEIRRNEILSFIRSGLRDLSVSRTTFKWGIQCPDDPGHVIYVWVDALTNYLSVLGGPDAKRYQRFWPAQIHLIGKDILRFHAVYWPTMLLSAGLPLPLQIVAHGWWTINGQKMSKSLRNVVEPNLVADDVGRDALRYFVARETPLGSDGDFSHEGLIQRINAELANDLGNLLNRSLAMATKYCGGRAPSKALGNTLSTEDRDLMALAERCAREAAQHFEAPAPSKALESIWELVRGTNRYIDRCAPYRLAKDPAQGERVAQIVANYLESLRWISLMVSPVMPDKARELRQQLGYAADEAPLGWPTTWCALPADQRLSAGVPLFPRIEDERKAELLEKWCGRPEGTQEEAMVEKEKAPGPAPTRSVAAEPIKADQISFDEFLRVDLRVAEVLEAERVADADRLLRLRLDIGSERRQVVAGIAEAYDPNELIGRQVIFVSNLKPAKIRGIESQGMILAAGEKKVLALSALDRRVEPGTKIR
jgi:methionyl-tRNA synthetase